MSAPEVPDVSVLIPDAEVTANGHPTAPQQPRGVLVGAGGDPLIVGLVFFGIASLCLGLALIHWPTAALGSIMPILIMGAGLYQLVTTVWAILLGQSIVAAIFSTFSAFWLSLSVLLLGVSHGWLGLTAASAAGAQQLFFIAWAVLFLLLVVPCLRLPAVYGAAVFLVFAACSLSAISAFTGTEAVSIVAGAVALAFAALAFYAWVNVAVTAMGGRALPLGRPIVR